MANPKVPQNKIIVLEKKNETQYTVHVTVPFFSTKTLPQKNFRKNSKILL